MQNGTSITDRSASSTSSTSENAGSVGFKFNSVGREEVTTHAIKPQADPAVTQRRVLIIGVVLLAFILLSYISWERSGRYNPFADKGNKQQFAAPTDRSFE